MSSGPRRIQVSALMRCFKSSFIPIQEIFSFLRCHVKVLPDPTHQISTGVSELTQNLTLGVRDPPMSVLALLSA